MDFRVMKVGQVRFDTLHACGLAILLNHLVKKPVHVVDEEISFHIYFKGNLPEQMPEEILKEILVLPSKEELVQFLNNPFQSLPLGNMDGLLAALITSTGIRVVSVVSLKFLINDNLQAIDKAIWKIEHAIDKWMKALEKGYQNKRKNWLSDILSDYSYSHPEIPLPLSKCSARVRLSMPIDPAFGFSPRSPNNNQVISHGISLNGTPYSSILAYIGAARFLRAEVGSRYKVYLYYPVIKVLVVDDKTYMPILTSGEMLGDKSLFLFWFNSYKNYGQKNFKTVSFLGICYQVMSTHAGKSPISNKSGVYEFMRLEQIRPNIRMNLLEIWEWMLRDQSHQTITISLCHYLQSMNILDWVYHLEKVVDQIWDIPRNFLYSERQIMEVFRTMNQLIEDRPISLFQRGSGAIQFGRMLRSLRWANFKEYRLIIHLLDDATNENEFLDSLFLGVQKCEILRTLGAIMIRVHEKDIKVLLDDLSIYGFRKVRNFIKLISAIEYDNKKVTSTDDFSI